MSSAGSSEPGCGASELAVERDELVAAIALENRPEQPLLERVCAPRGLASDRALAPHRVVSLTVGPGTMIANVPQRPARPLREECGHRLPVAPLQPEPHERWTQLVWRMG